MRLSGPARLFWYATNFGLGIVPSFLFFAWVERNASLPWVGPELGWPWLNFWAWPVPALAAFDFVLVLLFGLIHSFTAQKPFQRFVESIVPAQAVRSVFLIITGGVLLALMGVWQHTGTVLWALPMPTKASYALSLVIYWTLLFACGRFAAKFDPFQFIGLRQIAQSSRELAGNTAGNPELLTSGIYGWVRHPIYLFSMAAFVLAPVMTLDRMIVVAATALYLYFAIPFEEKKLIGLFGKRYEDYRRRVPAVLPWPRPLSMIGSDTR